MTELAIRQPAEVAMVSDTADLDGWIAVVQDVSRLAGMICDTDFVPKNYRGNPAAATAAILTGRELGLPPMTALRHVQLVEGSASLSAEYKRARVLSAGHEFDVLEASTTKCTVSGRRRGSNKPPLVITFALEDAQRAGLLRPSKSGRPGAWQTRPRRMLFARAGTELCDFLFADVTNGLPTTELLAEDSDGVTGYDEQPAEAARPAGRVTAAEIISSRPAGPQTASPADVQPSPAAPLTPPAEPAGEALPPLPGEDEPDPTTSGASSSAHAPGSASPQETGAPSPSSPDGSAAAPDDRDHDTPGTRSGGQLTAIWTILNTVFGFTKDEKDQARKVCAHIIGHPLESTNDLSYNAARMVLDTLGNWRQDADGQGTEPRAYLVGLMAAEAGAGDD